MAESRSRSHDSLQLLRARAEEINVILVVGLTGAGKSFFISSIAGEGTAPVGHNLVSREWILDLLLQPYSLTNPDTESCSIVATKIGPQKVLLVDTPGFDDTNYAERSDSVILADIAKVLSKQYELGASLKGLVYIHNITSNKVTGSAMKNLIMFRQIVGDQNLANVILATTQWSKLKESEGASRENDLRSNFWGPLLAKGSHMARYHGDRESAVGIISQLLGKKGVVLEIQRELADGRRLEETSAGALVHEKVGELQNMLHQERKEAKRMREEAKGDKDLRAELQKAIDDNEARLMKTAEDEETLRAKILEEIRAELAQKLEAENKQNQGSKKGSNAGKIGGIVASVVTVAVHLFLGFMDIDTDFADTVHGWFN